MSSVEPSVLEAIVEGRCPVPFDTLGIHPLETGEDRGRVIRVFVPWASLVRIEARGNLHPTVRVHREGFFEARFPGWTRFHKYRLEVTDYQGQSYVLEDPYRFSPVHDEAELLRLVEGKEWRAHRLLGAHVTEHEGIAGTRFAVWAPHAGNVNLKGSFNGWDARCHPMRPRGSSGIWELFLPGVGEGATYKYEIRDPEGRPLFDKADPCGFAMELRPDTASVVWDMHRYGWRDQDWMRNRVRRHAHGEPVAIYEVHLGSWRRKPDADPGGGWEGWLTYRELADELLPYVRDMGFTHVELLPVTEHPLDQSWGYQTVGYFAPTSRFGSPDDFRHFVDRAHQMGLGVILDWVPAHFPSDVHGLVYFDGTHLYEHEDPRKGRHPDWGTVIYNYGRPAVTAFLISSALFWLEEYHVDGLRVDAVASMLYLDYSRGEGEWVPNEFGGRENLEAIHFLRRLNEVVHAECPGTLTFAEESTAWPRVSHPVYAGGLGFDFKWNMGWMNDTLEVMHKDALYRRWHYDRLTFSQLYAYSENFLLPLSHDEVVHGKASLLSKMSGLDAEKFANLRLLLGYMFGHPGKKLLFMGGELAQRGEWDHSDQVEWHLLEHGPHSAAQHYVRQLNRVYRGEPALFEVDFSGEGFEWVDCHDAERTTLSFIRWARDWRDFVVVVANFTPLVREGFRLGVPHPGRYRLILNSDAPEFGGYGVLVPPEMESAAGRCHGREQYLEFTLPPLSMLYFKRA